MNQLLGSAITYRITVGPQQGRKVFTLQTLPDCIPDRPFAHTVGKVAGFSQHAGVATRAHERADYNGVFAPNSKYRARVTSAKRGKGKKVKAPQAKPDQTPAKRRASMSWA